MYFFSFLLILLKDIILYKVIIITLYCWVNNIYRDMIIVAQRRGEEMKIC